MRRLTGGAAILRATEEAEWTSDKPSNGTPALLTWVMVNPVGTTLGEVNKGITIIRDKLPTVKMNHMRDAHITKVDTDRHMDAPSPTSSATRMKSKAIAVEATERNILMVNAWKKDAAVPPSHTGPANTRERVDRVMGIIPGPRGIKSMMTVGAPRGVEMSTGLVTATVSARGAMEAANTNSPVVVGMITALAETDMEVRKMRATAAGPGVMEAKILLAPRG